MSITNADRNRMRLLAQANSGNAIDNVLFNDRTSAPPETYEYDVISKSLCERIRESDKSDAELADELPFVKQTIWTHRTDRCQHVQGDVDPIRCCVMREMAHDGMTHSRIAQRFDVVRDTASYHVRGRCTCNGPTPPQTRHEVTPRVCARMRADALDGETITEIGDRYGFCKDTVSRHTSAARECHHDHIMLPARTNFNER